MKEFYTIEEAVEHCDATVQKAKAELAKEIRTVHDHQKSEVYA